MSVFDLPIRLGFIYWIIACTLVYKGDQSCNHFIKTASMKMVWSKEMVKVEHKMKPEQDLCI